MKIDVRYYFFYKMLFEGRIKDKNYFSLNLRIVIMLIFNFKKAADKDEKQAK